MFCTAQDPNTGAHSYGWHGSHVRVTPLGMALLDELDTGLGWFSDVRRSTMNIPKEWCFFSLRNKEFQIENSTFGKICRNHQPVKKDISLLVDVFVLGYGCSNERSGVCWPAGIPSTSVVLSGDMWPASTVSACEFATRVARQTFWIILALVPQSQKTLYPTNFQGFPVF